jgi:hypothetical protein
MYMEEINNTNDKLTPQQKACRKYYFKMKNDPDFIKKRNDRIKNRRLKDPEFVEKQRKVSLKNYYKIKDDPEYKQKVSLYKKEYWIKKKENNLLL